MDAQRIEDQELGGDVVRSEKAKQFDSLVVHISEGNPIPAQSNLPLSARLIAPIEELITTNGAMLKAARAFVAFEADKSLEGGRNADRYALVYGLRAYAAQNKELAWIGNVDADSLNRAAIWAVKNILKRMA